MAIDNMTAEKLAENARGQFNILFGNMLSFGADDMASYNKCYADVFGKGIEVSYMSATFYAQFSAEILVGMLSSNPFRKFLVQALDAEKAEVAKPMVYWDESMQQNRFGIAERDYTNDTTDLYAMMNVSYNKIAALNEWFGTEEGKKEFDMYCLSRKALRDMKRVVCEYPYLIRKYDHDTTFAHDIMEYAGIVAQQIIQTAGTDNNK